MKKLRDWECEAGLIISPDGAVFNPAVLLPFLNSLPPRFWRNYLLDTKLAEAIEHGA